jgi:hypothetical protein
MLKIRADLTIPDFLRVDAAEAERRRQAWIANPPREVRPLAEKRDYRKPKSLDAAGEAAWERMLAREQAKKDAEKARLNALPKKARA